MGKEKETAGRVVHTRKRRRVQRDVESDSEHEVQDEPKWKRVRPASPEERIAEDEEDEEDEKAVEDEIKVDIPAPTYPQRTFLPSVPIHPDFPLFYRRFWIPTSYVFIALLCGTADTEIQGDSGTT